MHQETDFFRFSLIALFFVSNVMAIDLHLIKSVLVAPNQSEIQEKLQITIEEVGEIQAPSRRLTVVDPGWMFPSKLTSTAALAPASQAIVKVAKIMGGENRGMPAFLIISYADMNRLKSVELVKWETLPLGEKGGYVSIDSGEIAVIDTAIIPRKTESDALAFGESVISLADVGKGAVIDPGKGSFVVVKSGNGDGAYPCYWLKDSKGEILALLIDFENWTPSQNPQSK